MYIRLSLALHIDGSGSQLVGLHLPHNQSRDNISVYVGGSRLPDAVVLLFVGMSQQFDCRTVSIHWFDGSGS